MARSPQDIVKWHLETAQNALHMLEELVNEEENLVKVRDVTRLISEHMEDLEFEYAQWAKEDHPSPKSPWVWHAWGCHDTE